MDGQTKQNCSGRARRERVSSYGRSILHPGETPSPNWSLVGLDRHQVALMQVVGVKSNSKGRSGAGGCLLG